MPDNEQTRTPDPEHPTSKAAVRAGVIAARRGMSASARARAGSALTSAVLSLRESTAPRTVAAYVSIGTEPPTAELLSVLRTGEVQVLVPVLLDDLDLDWAIYETDAPMSASSGGLWTPDGPRLGRDAVVDADLVVVPALAVGRDGTRLGRGGGSYDRALVRVPGGRPILALLYDGELVDRVPAEAHDRRVTHAITPSAVHRLPIGPDVR